MKSKIPTFFTMLVLCACLFGLTQAAGADNQVLSGGAPGVISYQGQVKIAGAPFTGSGYFKFAITDPSGLEVSYWSNDGTSVAGSEPSAYLTLPVSNGLFNALLGDTGQFPLSSAAFTTPNRNLRVWFSSAPASFTRLSPDQVIAAVPYALQASDSAALNGLPASHYILQGQANSITSAMIGSETITLANIGQNGCATGDVIKWSGRGWICGDDNGVVAKFLGRGFITQTSPAHGLYNSITVGSDGLGLISLYFFASGDGSLAVLHCGNLLCNYGNLTTGVDFLMAGAAPNSPDQPNARTDVGNYNSITLGADGLGLISYYDFSYDASDLVVMHCGNVTCNSGNTITHVDSVDDVGQYTSIAIGANGLGLISYFDVTNQHLKSFACADIACTSGSAHTIDLNANVGQYTSLAIGPDGLGLIAYFDAANGNLKVAHCSDVACSSAATNIVVDTGGIVGEYASLTIGADGLGLVSYYDRTNGDLKLLHCGNAACSAGNTLTSVDTAGDVGQNTSLTIGADGLGLVSYYDVTHTSLKLLHCGNLLCNGQNTAATLDAASASGSYTTAITIGSDGQALVSYFSGGGQRLLKMAGLSRR